MLHTVATNGVKFFYTHWNMKTAIMAYIMFIIITKHTSLICDLNQACCEKIYRKWYFGSDRRFVDGERGNFEQIPYNFKHLKKNLLQIYVFEHVSPAMINIGEQEQPTTEINIKQIYLEFFSYDRVHEL